MFENLSDRLERSFKILKGEGKITEINVAETLKDVRRALLDADVNYKVAKQFTDTVKQKAMGMNVLTAIKPGQLMVKISRFTLRVMSLVQIGMTFQALLIRIRLKQSSFISFCIATLPALLLTFVVSSRFTNFAPMVLL